MSYKLIGEHEDKYELMHPNGNTFYVAKKGVNKKVIDHIKSLNPVKSYYNGTDSVTSMDQPEEPVSSEIPVTKPIDPTQGIPQQTPIQKQFEETRSRIKSGNVNLPDDVIDKMAMDAVTFPLERSELASKNAAYQQRQSAQEKYARDVEYNAQAQKYGLPQRPVTQIPQPETISQKTVDQQAQLAYQQPSEVAPQRQESTIDQYTSGLGMMEAGLTGMAKSQGELAQKQVNILAQAQSDVQELENLHKKSQEKIMNDIQRHQTETEKEIDPSRLWGNTSTGNKIGASIAILLGGIGAGLTGRENVALNVIENAVQNDIKAQMENKAAKTNLYNKNLELYKNQDEAMKRTKLELLAQADSKLKQAELQAKSNEAKYVIQELRGKMRVTNAPIIEELSQKSTQREVLKLIQTNPEAVTPAMIKILPKEDQEKCIPGYGCGQIKPTDKDRETLSKTKDIKDDLQELIQMAKKGTTIPGTTASEINKNKVASVQLKLKDAFQLGVLSGSDYEMLQKLVPDPGSMFTKRAISGLQSTIQSMNGIEKSVLDKVGIVKKQAGPDYSDIKLMNGVPMVKVPGGRIPYRSGR